MGAGLHHRCVFDKTHPQGNPLKASGESHYVTDVTWHAWVDLANKKAENKPQQL